MKTLTHSSYLQFQSSKFTSKLTQLLSKSTLISQSSKFLLFTVMVVLGLITNDQIVHAIETETNNNTTPAQTNSNLLKLGSQGQEVQKLQTQLKVLKFFNEDQATGFFGQKTQEAVMAFQKANNLNPDGVVGATTQAKIAQQIDDLNKKSDQESEQKSENKSSVLKQNSQGDEVKVLQENLKKLNFFKTEITGYFGAVTKEAVIAFQKANNLTPDGVVGKTTQDAIQASLKNAPTSDPKVLKKEMTGQNVAMLQEKLKKIRYYDGPITRYFGNLTEEAVKKFQTKNNLIVNGVVDQKTQASINTQLQNIVDTEVSKPSVLKLGDEGEQVRLLQEHLTQAKVYSGPITGTFGNLTQEAVKKFQSQNGLEVDGIMGMKSQALLSSKIKGDKNEDRLSTSGFNAEQIAILQKKLQDLKYYQGKIDGALGPNTVSALKKFQAEQKIPTTGVFDLTTQIALNEKLKEQYSPTSQGDQSGTIIMPFALSQNPSEPEIQMVQRRLQIAGLYQGPINGVMNTETKKALAQARLAYGITETTVSR